MVGRRFGALALALACSWDIRGVLGGAVQAPVLVLPPEAATYRQHTVDVFQTSWNAYKCVQHDFHSDARVHAGCAESTLGGTMI